MRNLNLKFVSSVVFAITFLVGGFFVINNAKAATITLYPNGIGNFDDWTLGTSSSVTKFNAVGSSDTNDNSYIKETTDDQAQTFIIPGSSLSVGSTINSVTLNVIARKSEGIANIKLRLENGSLSTNDGPTNELIDTYITYSRILTTNPFTNLAWTLSEVNSWTTNFGVLYSDIGTNNGGRVTQISVVVDYTNEITLSSIAITTPATKLSYTVGDSLDISGLVVTGTYSDDSTSVVTPDSVTGFNSSAPVTDQVLIVTVNNKTITYTVTVTSASDGVATAFNNISTTLTSAGIANNLNTVTGSNYTNFSGLYFEKSIDGVKMGKITFTSALDLSKDATKTFLQNLGTKMDMAQAGIIGLDFSDNTPDILTDDPSLKGVSATIEFYGLDKLGFDASSTSDEINAKLIAYDDDENILNMSDLVDTPGIYTPPVGVCEVGGVCYVFSVDVNHFTKYKIDNATETTPNINGNANLGGNTTGVVITNPDQAVTVTVGSGTTNPTIDVSAFISLVEGEKTGTLPEINIASDVADVAIPDNTIVTGPADWNGVIDAPTSGTPAGGNAPAGFNVGDTVISIGSDSGTLVFDKPVTILLAGVTGTVGYRPALSNTWQTITNVCGGSYNTPTAPTAPGECAISNGTDTKIVTYHFTSFGGLDAVSHSNNNGSRPATLAVSAITTVGCNPKSGDLYNVNTGERCANDTSFINPIPTTNVNVINKVSVKTTPKPKPTPKPKELVVEPIQSVNELIETSVEQETPENNLTASVGRVSSLITGPISIWTILLIIVILLSGGYGIYSLKKNKKQKK
ncbi:MAG: bacterial Ig-like domain-containing protein [Candidatus Paceibacterota bacterium]